MDPSQASSSSLPSVHLPVAQSQATADESQRGASSASGLPPKSPIVDMEEKDLFGSESEDDAAAPAATAAAAPAGSAPAAPPGAAPADLFGEASEDNMDERDLFGTDDEGGDVDEKDLFGSEDDGEAAPPAASMPEAGVPAPPSRASTIEPSEMDEEDIFGRDLSDDEVEDKKELEEVVLRQRPFPSTGRQFAALKIPNILSIERKPFNPLKFSEDVRNGYKTITNTAGKQTFQLLNPENCIRWRFKKNEDGHMLTSDDGRPLYESNSRVVEWEDGSRTLYVGSEAYPLDTMPENVVLFEENSQEVNVCHGFIHTRLVAVPRSVDDLAHKNTKIAQFNKFEPNSRSLLINTDDQAYLRQQQALERDHQKDKEKREARMLKAGVDTKMNAAFLESDDDGGDGPSVKKPRL